MQSSVPAPGKSEQYDWRLFASMRENVDTRWDLLTEWQSSPSSTVYVVTQDTRAGAEEEVEAASLSGAVSVAPYSAGGVTRYVLAPHLSYS